MKPLNKKASGAMFDVRPVDKIGRVDFEKISNLSPLVNLARNSNYRDNAKIIPIRTRQNQDYEEPEIEMAVCQTESVEEKKEKPGNKVHPKIDFIKDLEIVLSNELNPHTELTGWGAEINEAPRNLHPRLKHILNRKFNLPEENFPESKTIAVPEEPQNGEFDKIISEILKKPAPVSEQIPKTFSMLRREQSESRPAELAAWLRDLKTGRPVISLNRKKEKKNFFRRLATNKFFISAAIVFASIFSLKYAVNLKNELIKSGNSAVQNLENAKDQLKNLDFTGASDSFAEAYSEFSKANSNLSFMGASISSLLGDLPGGGEIKSAGNLIEAGKLIADAGKAMAQTIDAISKTSLILNPVGVSGQSMGSILTSLKQGLSVSSQNLKKAGQLLADMDESLIPADKKESFEDFKSKLPLFEKLASDGLDYSGFLENLVGLKGSKKYLLLFQNPAELRPTGGFPGTYGIISFQDGSLSNFMVDDIYNPDGQLKENIIPPIPLQHITPTWAMRDANWFVDFPASARKMTQFFKKETGQDVDGVITLSPDIISQILEVVGPVQMPEYNTTIDSKNFITAVQNEVEYGKNRTEPKQILIDLAPRLLKKIYSASSDQWLAIFNTLVDSMDKKDILMYFRDLNLQSFVYDHGFTGQVKSGNSDYLMIDFSNVKGSKTDSVIDNSIKIDTDLSGGGIKHALTIVRKHNGGSSPYGFYNKQSPTYVRVLVPEGSELLSITGNSKPNFKPLVDYSKGNFKKDADLSELEATSYTDPELGVDISKESGKTVFGFWMIIDPGQTGKVELEYSIPLNTARSDYEFYVQKQPGMNIADFQMSFSEGGGIQITGSSPVLNKIGEKYILNQQFDRDLDLKMTFN